MIILVLAMVAGCKGGQAEWFEGSMVEALAEADERQTVLAVSVTAEWCPACHELDRQFWNTRHGRSAGEKYVLKLFDFDSEDGRRFVSRYSIISIPTTLVMDKEGHELGRIVGFEGVGEYRRTLAAISARTSGTDIIELEKMLSQRPDDLQVALELGEAMLNTGLQQQGIKVLEKVLVKDPKNVAGGYVDATRILGRYFVRCKHDYHYGSEYFQQAVDRFPDAEEVWEFRYWIGQAKWKSGNEDEALEYFKTLTVDHGDVAEAHSIRARFLQLQCVELEDALGAVQKARKLDPTDDWNCYVEAEILHKLGREEEAMQSLEKAIELSKEKKAIYLDRKEAWCK
ncbi:MAG: thioredoxin family protein [Deltaproteobacteria bacterium]|nr:thioredoxin family protein [Deltaproteobacteria bacterium]